jgi:hypothetical protein
MYSALKSLIRGSQLYRDKEGAGALPICCVFDQSVDFPTILAYKTQASTFRVVGGLLKCKESVNHRAQVLVHVAHYGGSWVGRSIMPRF